MTADEARKLAPENRYVESNIDDLMSYVYRQIEYAARNGRTQVVFPLGGYRGPLSTIPWERIKEKLLEDGYIVHKYFGDGTVIRKIEWTKEETEKPND